MNHQITSVHLDTKQAAEYTGFSTSALNNSRYTGTLAGVKAPKFLKIGKSVRYVKSTLDTWMTQFQEQTSTSEDPNNAA